MLYVCTKAHWSQTIWDFIWGVGWRRVPYIRPLSYEELFYQRNLPRGNYVFADFDRLTHYEIQCLGAVADALKAADPSIRIYNDPRRVLERAPLLKRLRREGINDFDVTRVDLGEKPSAYPVFIRCEDDCNKPDTGLLNSESEFDAAIADMTQRGIPLKRRIAVQYRAEKSPDGYFRKYGAIRLGDRIFPQHILRNTDWYVKKGQVERDAQSEAEFVALFDDFKSHADVLRPIFDLAGIDYGRVDYGFVDGRIQVFEINTNPTIPKLRRRREFIKLRYDRLRPALLESFAAMNTPHAKGPPVPYKLPKPMFQRFLPLDRTTASYVRRLRWRAAMTILRQPTI